MSSPAVVAIEWSRGVEDAWSDVASFVPKLVACLVILLIGWFVAKVIARIANRILERVGFDKAVERGGIKQVLARSDYDASDIVTKVVFYGLLLLVFQLAFGVFGDNPVSDMISSVVAYLPKVLAAIIIVVVAAAIASVVGELISSALGGLSYGPALGNIASVAIIVVGGFAALNQLQIAPAIVNGLFYAVLAIVVGSAIVAIGGGGIHPMRQRWENALARYDEEKPRLQREMRTSRQRDRRAGLDQPEVMHGQADVDLARSEQEAPQETPRLRPQ